MALDKGHKEADKQLRNVQKRLKKEYQKAYEDMKEKTDAWLEQFRRKEADMLSKLRAGEITHKEFIEFREHYMMTSRQMKGICTELGNTLTDYNERATAIINGHARSVFVNNYNYGAYEVCKGTGTNIAFHLVDEKTVDRLLGDNVKLLPQVDLDKVKDVRWNMQKVQSALTQGILQGDSIGNISKRLQQVTNMTDKAAVRNARTMTTSAENGGRQAVYEEAEAMGIELEKTWVATLDDRTRDSHVELDGQTIPVDQKFKNADGELMFPADPDGTPENVYNCRCTMITSIKGHKRDLSSRQMGPSLGNWSYETWKKNAMEQIEARKK